MVRQQRSNRYWAISTENFSAFSLDVSTVFQLVMVPLAVLWLSLKNLNQNGWCGFESYRGIRKGVIKNDRLLTFFTCMKTSHIKKNDTRPYF